MWETQKEELISNDKLKHERSHEYASHIMEAIVTGKPYKIGGNVINSGLITKLPTQLAAMNVSNINVQLLTIEAAVTQSKEKIYQAAMMDPHTAAELSIDDIVSLCDDLIEAHGDWLPKFK